LPIVDTDNNLHYFEAFEKFGWQVRVARLRRVPFRVLPLRGGKSRAGLYSHTVDGWLDRLTMTIVILSLSKVCETTIADLHCGCCGKRRLIANPCPIRGSI